MFYKLRRKLFVWHCYHCPHGNSYNTCMDDDCTIKYWIKSIIWERRRKKCEKIR